MANMEKHNSEEIQRAIRKQREESGTTFSPHYFNEEINAQNETEYIYNEKYWQD